jgi:UDP:flavonoid glycosyltransferase YjiC (YdhE family)
MSDSGRFLIASWDGGGNTPSALNLGARLARQGHRVRLLGWDSMAARVAAAGLEFANYPSVSPFPTDRPLDDDWEARAKVALHGPGPRDDILAQAKDFDPDVVVVDCMLGAGFDAAGTLGLPTAVLVHVMFGPFRYEWGGVMLGLDVSASLDRAGAVLALTPPGLDAPCALPSNTTYVGPISAPPPREPLHPLVAEMLAESGDPWVLLSLSTTLQGQATAIPPILDALATMPVRVLLTLADVLPTDAFDVPPNVRVRGYVPHDLVMGHMAAVISHGGLSTITNALAGGVPILCIPQGREQPINAARVEACGVGRMLAPGASAPEIARAVQGLLDDREARAAAGRFADVTADLGYGAVATEQVIGLWRGPRAVSLG